MAALEDALLSLVPFATAEGFATNDVIDAFRSSGDGEKRVHALRDAMVTGQLIPDVWRAVTSAEHPSDPAVAFGALWDALVTDGVTTYSVGMPTRCDYESLRLWAYTHHWYLFEQDEDLFLMHEDVAVHLLRIAVEPGCPKRDLALEIVAHWARDTAFQKAGTAQFREFAASLGPYESLAKQAGAEELATYLARLRSYSRPETVHREGALQRGMDLTRCREPASEEVSVERDGKHWLVTLPGYTPRTIRIAQTDGRIR